MNALAVKPKIQQRIVKTEEKIYIKAAYSFMPLQDREYYSAVLKIDVESHNFVTKCLYSFKRLQDF